MAEKDDLPGDGDADPGSRTQDQRGNTQRIVDAGKLQNDVEDGLRGAGNGSGDDGGDAGGEHQEDIASLRRQLKREQARREQAERDRDEHANRAGDALDAKAQADLTTLQTAKNSIEAEQTDLRRKLAAAHADGDFDAVAEITQMQAEAAQRKVSIENGIIALENQPKQREALRRRGEPDDARYHQITKGMDPVSKAWFRENPEYYREDRLLNRVIAAHHTIMSLDDAPEVNTDAYIEAIEKELGRHDPKFRQAAATGSSSDDDPDDAGGEALSGAAGGERRRTADTPPGGAPVSRSGRTGNGVPQNNGSRNVRLTKEEQEVAEMSGQTHQEYWDNKQELIRQQRVGARATNRNQMH